MRINGQGLVCKKCRTELNVDMVTMYAPDLNSAPKPLTNCCKERPVKKSWLDKLREKWKR